MKLNSKGVAISKQKILLLQPSLQPPGGGNAVAVWILEALKQDYDIRTLTWEHVDLAKINDYYGTDLQEDDFRASVLFSWIRFFVDLIPDACNPFQRHCALMRWCKLIQDRYDLIISVNSETDFGTKGLQYVHFPYLRHHPAWKLESTEGHHGFRDYCKKWAARLRPWRIISGFSFERMKQNLTLVNSEWTGEIFQEAFGVKAQVLTPPVAGNFLEMPWEKRENGFVCIGRISGEKRLEEIIDILSAVRAYVPDIKLHIIGSVFEPAMETYRRLQKKVAKHASWVFLYENCSREILLKHISLQRYGIHGMENEHFGIAVAEMLCGGCIPFIPNSGGQVEIVDHNQQLLYGNQAEAVEKIVHVLKHPEVQQSLREILHSRKMQYTSAVFCQNMREIVRDFLK